MSDTHPLTLLGVAIAAGGWLFLLFGTGMDAGEFGTSAIYNIHLGAIADNVILLGYAVAISGVIASVGNSIRPNTQVANTSNENPVEHTAPAPRLDDASASQRAATLRSSLDRSKSNLSA